MFTLGLFATLGFSPGGVLFNTFVNETAIIALLIIVWFMHDSIITPIKTMWHGYRVCGGLGIIGMLLAFLSGFTIITHLQSGLILLGAAFAIWFVAIVAQR
jgi:uncharacterized membrane protein HdeD (DUF308 family)